MTIIIDQFIIGNDNYAVLLHDTQTKRTAAIDAMDSSPILLRLEALNWQLTDLFVTHKHSDHINGITGLKKHTNCTVQGPAQASADIGTLDVKLKEDDTIQFGSHSIDIWETPGHCSDHISFIFSQEKIAFMGDTLFPLGCGRIFDSDAKHLYKSFERIAQLPDDMMIYSGHEYTLSNLKFALSLEPNNRALQERGKIIEALRAQNKPTVPTTIALEKATNPFLRLDSPEILQTLDMVGASSLAVFTEIRKRKDIF